MEEKKEKVIDVYITDYCPYCTFAKQLLKAEGFVFQEHDLTHDKEGREALRIKAGGRTTVPQIFVNDHCIGGFEDLKKWITSGCPL